MADPKLILENQFGEVSENYVTGGNGSYPEAEVAALSAASTAGAITIALSTGNTYSDAAVNTAVNAALTSVVTDLNTIITALNDLLTALKTNT